MATPRPADLTKKAYIRKARVYFQRRQPAPLLYNGMRKYPIDPEIGSQWTTNSSYSNEVPSVVRPLYDPHILLRYSSNHLIDIILI